VTEYDAAHRVPRWSAWRVLPEYLDPPTRRGRWSTFRADPSIPNPVRDADYNGVGSIDMARGHIVPYFVSGGDRDGDGLTAANDQGALVDPDDACTIYEINYLSNVAPQHQSGFNGSAGLWNRLETGIRQDIVGPGTPIHIIAGTVFGNAPVNTVGPRAIPSRTCSSRS
jgi:endonuclease G, mitochondrial